MTQTDLETISLSIKNHLSNIGYTCDFAWKYRESWKLDGRTINGPLSYVERDYKIIKVGGRHLKKQTDFKIMIRFVRNGISITKAHVGRVLDYEMAPYCDGSGFIEYCNPAMLNLIQEACALHVGELEPEHNVWVDYFMSIPLIGVVLMAAIFFACVVCYVL